jgi:Aldo/keto reductase family
VGARPLAPSAGFVTPTGQPVPLEGLSAKVIRESAERSLTRLGVSRLDVLYAHIEDPAVPAAETVEGFAELVADGIVGLLGVSNHWAWRVERARALALAAGVPGYEVLQYQYSYLRPRTDLPGRRSAGPAARIPMRCHLRCTGLSFAVLLRRRGPAGLTERGSGIVGVAGDGSLLADRGFAPLGSGTHCDLRVSDA